METIKVLFVCMGNICRSPTAQGVFEKLVSEHELADRIVIDSAGTHAYHIGETPDARATQAALRRGIDLSTQRARRVVAADFDEFDYVLAMDSSNYADLSELSIGEQGGKLRLFLEFAAVPGMIDVPDPYYGGATGFERVLDLIEEGSIGLLEALRRQHGL